MVMWLCKSSQIVELLHPLSVLVVDLKRHRRSCLTQLFDFLVQRIDLLNMQRLESAPFFAQLIVEALEGDAVVSHHFLLANQQSKSK